MKIKINRLLALSAVLFISSVASAQQEPGNKKAVPGNAPEAAIPATPKKQIDQSAEQQGTVVPGNNYKTIETGKLVHPTPQKHDAENRKPQLVPVAPSDAAAPVTKETKTKPAGPQLAKPVVEQ